MLKRSDGLPLMVRNIFLDRLEGEIAQLPWQEVTIDAVGREAGRGTVVALADGRRPTLGPEVEVHQGMTAGTRMSMRIREHRQRVEIVDVRHPSPRIGRMALACIARFAPRPAELIGFLRDGVSTVDKLGQIDVPSTDGSGDHDTDGINIRTVDGTVRSACAHRGIEIGFKSITIRRTVPDTMAAALVGRPLADLVDIGFPIPREVTASAFDLYPGDGMIVDFDDPGTPLPPDPGGVAAMVARELAGI